MKKTIIICGLILGSIQLAQAQTVKTLSDKRVNFLQSKLNLSAAQTEKVATILNKELNISALSSPDSISTNDGQNVNEKILAELDPQQQQAFRKIIANIPEKKRDSTTYLRKKIKQ